MKKPSATFETAVATFSDLDITIGKTETVCTMTSTHNGKPVSMSKGWLLGALSDNFSSIKSTAWVSGKLSIHLDTAEHDTVPAAIEYLKLVMAQIDTIAKRFDPKRLDTIREHPHVDAMAISANSSGGARGTAMSWDS